ncbi:hypothetical protein SASPL_121084 [Salvia splendens]|uniref:Uncharacterized protein n=1 Tax=Salvia splendens TaxID=180675 RepID=A0A8X8XVT5_SALSN|nr:hypothetical protein SASPL_121084 [Salvia splendens]
MASLAPAPSSRASTRPSSSLSPSSASPPSEAHATASNAPSASLDSKKSTSSASSPNASTPSTSTASTSGLTNTPPAPSAAARSPPTTSPTSPLSTSLRFLSNPPPPPELERQESSLELYVEREESRHGSSRFCIGGSFRKKEEEEAPIPESMDCESPPSPAALHRFNHKIVVSEAVLKNRWSNVSSSDIMFLNSEILMNDVAEEEATRFSSVEERKTAEETVIMSIKEEMGKKRALEGKVREINKEMNFPATSSGANRAKLGFESSSINPNDKRSMSEIVVHPRFQDLGNKDSRVEEINVKDERTRRLWLPIVRKTVQWFANRERITPQSQESRLNI